jgi:rod shape-determining protein MreC
LELTALAMLIQSHNYHASRFASSSHAWAGNVLENYQNSADYLSLRKVNSILAEENTALKNLIQQNSKEDQSYIEGNYQFISAKVIKNSYNKRNNYLTINKGALHGLENGMGVCVDKGVVGIIRDVSEHYATVMSLLNNNTVISTRFAKSNHFGDLRWDGHSHEYAQLYSIEKYVDVSVGDSLITNSYSSVFPEGLNLGTVNRFERDEQANFYDIEVNLAVDFSNIDYVYIVKNQFREERQLLESKQGE